MAQFWPRSLPYGHYALMIGYSFAVHHLAFFSGVQQFNQRKRDLYFAVLLVGDFWSSFLDIGKLYPVGVEPRRILENSGLGCFAVVGVCNHCIIVASSLWSDE